VRSGLIEFVGRADHQVKVRGFRIELEEIDGALLEHPTVQNCAVLVREDVQGEKRIVAYVTPTDPSEEHLIPLWREHLRSLLPEYMVPSLFMIMESMPLSATGKLDKKALPAPESDRQDDALTTSFVAPRNALEETLAGFWKEGLGLETVGVHDNFFELGGHSLMATRVISMIREQCGAHLSLAEFFSQSTIAQLAVLIEEARTRDGKEEAPIQAVNNPDQMLEKAQAMGDDDLDNLLQSMLPPGGDQ